jgi:hypothetical protein
MIACRPTELEGYRVRLEPLELRHQDELAGAAADGALWELQAAAVDACRDRARPGLARRLAE